MLNNKKHGEIQGSLSEPDVEAIRLLERRWLAEELAGNLNGVLELCSDDIVWLPPGFPALKGKSAIRIWLEHPDSRIEDITLSNVSLYGNESIAYKLADFRTRYVPAGSTSSVEIKGNHLWILRRNRQSVWQVVVVAWAVFEEQASNSSPAT
ncbi:MAG TPA: nuclear transport factor 2 family protein [Terriglobia bacterium]|nr:nuclear transport factor 2 family protein [Terriglobia bacterium]